MYQCLLPKSEGTICVQRSKPQEFTSTPHDAATSMTGGCIKHTRVNKPVNAPLTQLFDRLQRKVPCIRTAAMRDKVDLSPDAAFLPSVGQECVEAALHSFALFGYEFGRRRVLREE